MLTRHLHDNHFPEPGFPLSVQEKLQFTYLIPHAHLTWLEIVLVLSGYGVNQLESGSHDIHGGDLLILPSREKHTYHEYHDLRFVNLLADWEELRIDLRDLADRPAFQYLFGTDDYRCFRLDPGYFETIRTALSELRLTIQKAEPGYHFAAIHQYCRILDLICDGYDHALQHGPQSSEDRIIRLEEYLQHHFAEKFTTAWMCRQAMVSRTQLFTLFQRYFQTPPLERLVQIRMRHACRLLHETTLPIGQIAAQCGYDSQSLFTLHFRQRHGMTPRQFRLRG
jgi:AraC family L-rhamnose operon transcriptional activator RhaR/AraC family L-rhamnose operon regulatory protein RhaS